MPLPSRMTKKRRISPCCSLRGAEPSRISRRAAPSRRPRRRRLRRRRTPARSTRTSTTRRSMALPPTRGPSTTTTGSMRTRGGVRPSRRRWRGPTSSASGRRGWRACRPSRAGAMRRAPSVRPAGRTFRVRPATRWRRRSTRTPTRRGKSPPPRASCSTPSPCRRRGATSSAPGRPRTRRSGTPTPRAAPARERRRRDRLSSTPPVRRGRTARPSPTRAGCGRRTCREQQPLPHPGRRCHGTTGARRSAVRKGSRGPATIGAGRRRPRPRPGRPMWRLPHRRRPAAGAASRISRAALAQVVAASRSRAGRHRLRPTSAMGRPATSSTRWGGSPARTASTCRRCR